MEKDASVPVTLSSAVLLSLLWVGIDVAVFGKVAGKDTLWLGGRVGLAVVVTIVELVRASHF